MFTKWQVLHDVGVLEEKLSYFIVEEVFQEYGCGFGKFERNDKRGGVLQQKEQLRREFLQEVIAKLKQSILNLKAKMKERRKQLPNQQGYSPSYEEKGPCKDYDNVGGSGVDIGSPSNTDHNYYHFRAYSIHEDDDGRKRNEVRGQLEESNMYAQMKHQPRKRYKSRAIQTQFASYEKRKLNK
ncbi:hypothetical protein DEO72_LG2g3700 [Vigna unguiculata]|uniref:Uncharacterized protein n=1 Tax=Vigna unguiculata TaxID=3917 RepID=A0A4D6L4E0_VIGUN|nr:hypothetical protein DEO72_LG2g3700 [Vigna unguiculata]